jgi:hypothetical protein
MKTIWAGDIQFLSPCFCRGAYQDVPEIRVPSVRGMVRWWFRKLGGKPIEEKQVFGGMKRFAQGNDGEVLASSVVFRITATSMKEANPKPATLPHKQGGLTSPQAAFAGGGAFRLEVSSLRAPLTGDLERKLCNALEVWILLGSLGFRANRAGGSLWPLKDAPSTPGDLRSRLSTLGCEWPAYLAGTKPGATLDSLRGAATDTLDGFPNVFGSARPRQASAVKMKLVQLDDRLRLLVTAPSREVLEDAKQLLASKPISGAAWLPF